MDNLVVFDECTGMTFNAGGKAAKDVVAVLRKKGARVLRFEQIRQGGKLQRVFAKLIGLLCIPFLALKVPRGSSVLIQKPGAIASGAFGLWLIRILKCWRRAKVILLIHDIDECRFADYTRESVRAGMTLRYCRMADVLIVHNEHMKKWVQDYLEISCPIVCLGLFDYCVSEGEGECPLGRSSERLIAIAGNLDPHKVGYLERLPDIPGWRWALYGNGFDRKLESRPDIVYCGKFPPDELPDKMQGTFGLVWDGPSADGCQGALGNYLRINNPHKLSLYLSAGIPVITWREAAIADFVQSNQVGIVVDRLDELAGVLADISNEEYAAMKKGAEMLKTSVRAGYYTSQVLSTAQRALRREALSVHG